MSPVEMPDALQSQPKRLALARWLNDERLPRLAVTLAALVFAAMFFYTALARISYPYDLDFDEDSILMEALRVAHGQPVYVAPNAVFDPHVYMPLYFWLGALLLKFTSANLVPLRLISLAATLATTWLIYFIARREAGRRWLGVACAGLFLGGYRVNGFWYEVARVDSLFVALLLGGLALGIYAGASNNLKVTSRRLFLSAVVLALAFFTKQSAAFVSGAFALYLLIRDGRRAWFFIGTFAALTLIPLLTFNVITDGWFFYHVFFIGAADPLDFSRVVNFVAFDLFGAMAALSVMAIAATWLAWRRDVLEMIRAHPWLVATLFAVLISGLGRARVGGNLNDRMPAYALLCLAPALLMKQWRDVSAPSLLRWTQRVSAATIIGAAILIQFALGVYNPPRYIPTAQMRASGDNLIRRIASYDGNVFVMMHPYYALRAGKEPSGQIATLWYVRDRGAFPLPDDLVTRVRNKFYAAIISDESDFETDPALRALLDANYFRAETLSDADAPPTLVGVVVRPTIVYLPK